MAYHQRENSDITLDVDGFGRIAIEIKWFADRERLEVASITIAAENSARPIAAVLFERIPFAALIAEARRSLTPRREIPPQEGSGPDKTRTLSDELLRHVAELYLEAWRQGFPVQQYVAATLDVSIPTAARRISLARSRGYISHEINNNQRKNQNG